MEGLEGLTRLRALVLDYNRIKALGEGSLAGQGRLLELHLTNNRLRKLSHLEPLVKLRQLYLAMNNLQVGLFVFLPPGPPSGGTVSHHLSPFLLPQAEAFTP